MLTVCQLYVNPYIKLITDVVSCLTIISISLLNDVFGSHPSMLRAFVESPSKTSTSVGR